eukprot:TRINITY_DN1738_c0_g5_i1.p1 TRINITY_DN1738_c0_g5~~TRINITY_DN1738_c0_g5_i1.p1  ORF type:complete len:435 (+),score=131.65 TRINITY_DN1738_c0_g5_i1:318-1622(+)
MVDSRPTQQRRQPYSQRGRSNWVKQRAVGGRNWQAKEGVTKKAKKRKFKRVQWTNWAARNRKFDSSIEVDPNWGEPLSVIQFTTLAPLSTPAPKGSTLESYGCLELFNDSYSRLTSRQEKPLERNWAVDRKFYQVTSSDDPVLQRLSKTDTGNVFITDSILAVLMTSLRSKYSWDIVVKKKGDNIFFDKRDNSALDYLTVNENSTDPPQEESSVAANALQSLHKEATFINYNFSQQILLDTKSNNLQYPKPNPFKQDEDNMASLAYFYRSFPLDAKNKVVVRSEVDGYQTDNDKKELFVAKSLNEYDLRITGGWRQKLETQRAGTFATEVKNNNTKLARWGVQAYLAEADLIKLGFVSRTSLHDPYSHVVLGVETHRANKFLPNMGCDVNQFWGVFQYLVNQIRSFEEDGRYLILRSPNEKQLMVYRVGNTDLR